VIISITYVVSNQDETHFIESSRVFCSVQMLLSSFQKKKGGGPTEVGRVPEDLSIRRLLLCPLALGARIDGPLIAPDVGEDRELEVVGNSIAGVNWFLGQRFILSDRKFWSKCDKPWIEPLDKTLTGLYPSRQHALRASNRSYELGNILAAKERLEPPGMRSAILILYDVL